MRRYPPGPKAHFFGIALSKRFRERTLEFLVEVGRIGGDLGHFAIGPIHFYLVNHPDLIREVLVTKAKLFPKLRKTTDVIRQVEGNGIVVTEGDFWLRQRRLVQPAFAPARLARYADLMVEYTNRALERWGDGAVVDMAGEMRQLTLAIIARTLFDVELTGKAANLDEAGQVLGEVLPREMSAPIRLPDWLPLPGKARKRWAIRVFDELIWDVIRQRRASGEDMGDLLSMLLKAVDAEGDGTGMTDTQARDEAMSLFHAGHETAASGLSWLWYVLVRQPEVASRVVAEVDAVLNGRTARMADLSSLAYTQMVVKETLRLYPPVYILFGREAAAEVELGGYPIPKGAWVHLSPFVTQRDPRFFPDPEKFDPERFAPGHVEQIKPHAYFPFGAGPHVCIGNTFALVEMTLITATVLRRFRLEFAPDQPADVEPHALLALRPKGGLRLRIASRTARLVPAASGQ
jgi:cytochrome P450